MGMTFQDFVQEAKDRVQEISVQEVKAKLDVHEPVILVDVREDSEWAHGHIPGAVHCSRGVLEMRAPGEIGDVGAAVVCYCGGGARSVLAADVLQKMGYHNVLSMAGGFSSWAGAGLPVEKD